MIERIAATCTEVTMAQDGGAIYRRTKTHSFTPTGKNGDRQWACIDAQMRVSGVDTEYDPDAPPQNVMISSRQNGGDIYLEPARPSRMVLTVWLCFVSIVAARADGVLARCVQAFIDALPEAYKTILVAKIATDKNMAADDWARAALHGYAGFSGGEYPRNCHLAASMRATRGSSTVRLTEARTVDVQRTYDSIIKLLDSSFDDQLTIVRYLVIGNNVLPLLDHALATPYGEYPGNDFDIDENPNLLTDVKFRDNTKHYKRILRENTDNNHGDGRAVSIGAMLSTASKALEDAARLTTEPRKAARFLGMIDMFRMLTKLHDYETELTNKGFTGGFIPVGEVYAKMLRERKWFESRATLLRQLMGVVKDRIRPLGWLAQIAGVPVDQ